VGVKVTGGVWLWAKIAKNISNPNEMCNLEARGLRGREVLGTMRRDEFSIRPAYIQYYRSIYL
jgi:hypothetical protein